MNRDKVAFLKSELVMLCKGLKADSAGKWGKMNAQQMIEHVVYFFDVSSGKIKFDVFTPEDQLPKYKAFLHSDKEFRENTKAPADVLGEEPMPLRYASMKEATNALNTAVTDFFTFFSEHPEATTNHPVFGPLNFEEWVLLHYKHVNHHLRQFHSE